MTRVELGSKWKEAPLIVRLLRVLPSSDGECPDYEERQRRTDADHLLQPPAPRGYGYATVEDLQRLGYDPTQDRHNDLKRWAHDLDLGVAAGLITQAEGERAWASATKNNQTSTSSTGTSSTPAPPATNRSSKDSPFVVAGQLSPQQRKRANRRSSSPSQWKPQEQDSS